jgi:serine O-acetyltransferase
MMNAFSADIRRYADRGRPLSFLSGMRVIGANYGLQALLGYRLGRFLLRARKIWFLWPVLPPGALLYWLISRYAWHILGIRLELSAQIGPGLYIGHFGGILVRNCQLGQHCSIAQSVHIGPVGESSGPVIGDRVWIGAHARIVGSYEIGARSTVSAGASVQRDIPETTLCLGNPARVVMRDYDNSRILDAV